MTKIQEKLVQIIKYNVISNSKHVCKMTYKEFVELMIVAKEQQFDLLVMSLFGHHLLGLCQRLFEVQFEYLAADINEEHLTYLEHHALNHGVFGHADSKHYINSAFKRYLQDEHNISGISRWMSLIKVLFPMSKLLPDRYGYAKRVKVLLPIAWLHRLIHESMFYRKRGVQLLVSTPDGNDVGQRVEVLKTFNLQKKF